MLLRVFIALLCLFLAVSSQAASGSAAILEIQNLIKTGDLAAAQAKLSDALKTDPKNGGLYNLRGILNAQAGNVAVSESDFSQATSLDPNLTSAWLNLGRVYQQAIETNPNTLAKAVHAYEQAYRLDPHSDEANYQLGLLFEWQGAFQKSLAHLTALSDPERKRARSIALECADYAALGNHAEAQKTAQALVHAADFSENEIQAILPVLEQKHQDKITQIVVTGLMRRTGVSLETQVSLARACENLKDFEQARELMEKVVRQQPSDVRPLLDLARIAYRQRDREGALGYLAHARDLDPRNATVHFVFGIIALEMRLPLEAQDSVKKALDLDPPNPDFNYGMGVVKLHVHETLEAVPYFQKFLAVRKDSARGHYGLGIAYYFGGKYQESSSELRLAAAARETSSGAHYFLGRIAKLNGDDSNAEAEFRLASAKDPANAEARSELAALLTRSRKFGEARQELDRALAVDPNNFVANTNLLVLYQRTKDARAAQQAGKLQALTKKRDELQELLYRRIEVRPY